MTALAGNETTTAQWIPGQSAQGKKKKNMSLTLLQFAAIQCKVTTLQRAIIFLKHIFPQDIFSYSSANPAVINTDEEMPVALTCFVMW